MLHMTRYRGGLAILAFSLSLGVFAKITFAPHVRAQYLPAWGRAAWIEPQRPAAIAYFRKEVFLPGVPVKAHVQIAASDTLDFYVNGKWIEATRSSAARSGTRSSAEMISTSTSAAFDIASYLTPGKNVLAARVKLRTAPAKPQLILHGMWRDRQGIRQEILSDISWRVATREEWQAGRALHWYDTSFSDLEWSPAGLNERGSVRPVQYLDLPPALLDVFPRGAWIWSADSAAQQAGFRRVISLDGESIDAAWIGISSDAAYELAINGHVLAGGLAREFMDTYDVARYLERGENTVTLGMTRIPPPAVPRLAVALMIDVDGTQLDFSSDGQWQVTPAVTPGSSWEPVAILGAMTAVPLITEVLAGAPVQRGFPALRVLESAPPTGWWLQELAATFAWVMAALAGNLLLVWLGSRIRAVAAGYSIAAPPWGSAGALGTLLLCFLFLLQYDVRVDRAAIFQPGVLLGAWAAVVLFVALVMLAPLLLRVAVGDHGGQMPGERR